MVVRTRQHVVTAHDYFVALREKLEVAQPTITAVWPLLVVGHELMNGLSVVAAREQISLTIVMTTEHEKHIRVAADHLEELLAIAPANVKGLA